MSVGNKSLLEQTMICQRLTALFVDQRLTSMTGSSEATSMPLMPKWEVDDFGPSKSFIPSAASPWRTGRRNTFPRRFLETLLRYHVDCIAQSNTMPNYHHN